jgi:hypothetical protein
MDRETASRIIRAENRGAQELLRAGLIDRGRQAEALAKALRPWVVKGRREGDWRKWGPRDRRMEPELRRALSAALNWRNIRPLTGGGWHSDPSTGGPPIYSEPVWDEIPEGIWGELVYLWPAPDALYARGEIAYAVHVAHDGLEYCAKFCREARPPEVVLVVPDEVHPPGMAGSTKGCSPGSSPKTSPTTSRSAGQWRQPWPLGSPFH